MSSFPERLLDARKDKKLSQQELAKSAGVHFTNLGKYERGEAIPSADILNNIAKALDVTTDYLLNGTVNDKAGQMISDQELLMQFKKIEALPSDKKKLVIEFLDSFVLKSSLMSQLARK